MLSYKKFLIQKKKSKEQLQEKTWEDGFWVYTNIVEKKERNRWTAFKSNFKCLFSKQARQKELDFWKQQFIGSSMLKLNDKGRKFILEHNNYYESYRQNWSKEHGKDPYLHPELAKESQNHFDFESRSKEFWEENGGLLVQRHVYPTQTVTKYDDTTSESWEETIEERVIELHTPARFQKKKGWAWKYKPNFEEQ